MEDKMKDSKDRTYNIAMMISNILIVIMLLLLIYICVEFIKNKHNHIDSGIIIDKHYTSSSTTPTRFGIIHRPESYTLTITGEKDGKCVKYTFYCTEDEYSLYEIGDTYIKEKT
jgi:hypothetical protein